MTYGEQTNCNTIIKSVLNEVVPPNTTALCAYEQGFVDVKESDCCPQSLIHQAMELARPYCGADFLNEFASHLAHTEKMGC